MPKKKSWEQQAVERRELMESFGERCPTDEAIRKALRKAALTRKEKAQLERKKWMNPNYGYNPMVSEEELFKRWERERLGFKEEAQDRIRRMHLSEIAMRDRVAALEKGLAQGVHPVRGARAAAKRRPRGWRHSAAERSLRRSGWLGGPVKIIIPKPKQPNRPGKKWIQKAVKRPGALRAKFAKWFGLKAGHKISPKMYTKGYAKAKRAGDTRTMRQINLARNLSRYSKRKSRTIRGVSFSAKRRKAANKSRRESKRSNFWSFRKLSKRAQWVRRKRAKQARLSRANCAACPMARNPRKRRKNKR